MTSLNPVEGDYDSSTFEKIVVLHIYLNKFILQNNSYRLVNILNKIFNKIHLLKN